MFQINPLLFQPGTISPTGDVTLDDPNAVKKGEVEVSEPSLITTEPVREQFEADREKLNPLPTPQPTTPGEVIQEAREGAGPATPRDEDEIISEAVPLGSTPEKPNPIDISTANKHLQDLVSKVGGMITQFREQGGTLSPESEALIRQINNAELNKAAALAKASTAAEKGDAKETREAMAEADKAESEQQDRIKELTEEMKAAREAFLETLKPSEREIELKRKLNTLRTERQLLPLELRQQGISAAGIKAGQIEDERVRAIQEQNLLLELGLEQEARQAEQKFAETKLGFIEDDIETQIKIEEAIREQEQAVVDEARKLRKEALNAMNDIVSSLEGLAWEDLDAETQAEVLEMAQSFGIPINTLASALKVAKQQKVLDNSRKSAPSTQTERQREKESQATSIINERLREGQFEVRDDGTISRENYDRLRAIWAARIGDPKRFDEIFKARLLGESDIEDEEDDLNPFR